MTVTIPFAEDLVGVVWMTGTDGTLRHAIVVLVVVTASVALAWEEGVATEAHADGCLQIKIRWVQMPEWTCCESGSISKWVW